MGKGRRHQASQSKFEPYDLCDGCRELTPQAGSSGLHTHYMAWAQAHTHIIINKYKLKISKILPEQFIEFEHHVLLKAAVWKFPLRLKSFILERNFLRYKM